MLRAYYDYRYVAWVEISSSVEQKIRSDARSKLDPEGIIDASWLCTCCRAKRICNKENGRRVHNDDRTPTSGKMQRLSNNLEWSLKQKSTLKAVQQRIDEQTAVYKDADLYDSSAIIDIDDETVVDFDTEEPPAIQSG
jgi:hypothetical protein